MSQNFRFVPGHTEEEIAAIQLAGVRWTLRHALSGSAQYIVRIHAS